MPADLVRVADPTNITVPIVVMRRYAEEKKLEHEVSQQDAWFILQFVTLEGTAITTPRKNDRVLKDGEYYTINMVNPKESHGELVGWELRCTGG